MTSYVPTVNPTAANKVESAPAPALTSASSGAPYISPIIQYDSDAAIAVLMFRDGDSGSVETQYPSERVVREYRLRGREGEASSPDSRSSESGGKSVAAATSSPIFVAAPGPGTGSAPSASASAVAPVASAAVGGGGLAVNVVA